MSDQPLCLGFLGQKAVAAIITAPVLVEMSVNYAHESLDSGHRQKTWLSGGVQNRGDSCREATAPA